MEQPVTVRDGSCTEDGLIEYYCTECHAALRYSIGGGHRPQAAERENEKGEEKKDVEHFAADHFEKSVE